MYRRKLLEWVKENRTLAVMIGLECLVLVWLILISLRPQYSYSVSNGELNWTQGPEVTYADDESAIFTPADIETEGDEYQSDMYQLEPGVALPAGGYTIKVEYDVVDDRDDETSGLSSEGGVTQFGYVECRTPEYYNFGLRSAKTILYYGKTQAIGRVWCSVLSNVEDINVRLTYNNNATISIKSITLEEQMIYRVTRLLGFLAIAAGIDVLVYLLADSRRDYRKRYVLFAIVGVATAASLTCFVDYLLVQTDLEYHLLRIGAVAEELKNGQFPVRIQTDAVNGAGYISPVFYSDFFLYIPAILYLMMVPLQTCYQIYIILVNLATAVISYYCFSKMFGSQKIGVLGTILYTFAADRLSGILVGASVGKYTALIFLPLIALGIYNILEAKEKIKFKEYLPLVIGLTGIIQSHILTCEMIVIFGVLFFLFNIREFCRKDRLIGVMKAGILTLMLNLFFILPFLMSWMMDINVKAREESIKAHGAYPVQLFSLFPDVNGWSNPMTMYEDAPASMGMALAIGGVAFLLCMMRSKEWGIQNERAYKYGKQMFGYGLLALFLCTIYFSWELNLGPVSKLLNAIQFPHRYLEMVTITFTLVSLCTVKLLWKQKERIYADVLSFVLVLMTLVSAGYLYSQAIDNKLPYRVYTYEELNTMDMGGGAEYVPGNWADVEMLADGKPVTESDDVNIIDYSKDGMVTTLRCENSGEDAYVELPLFCYDNYVVRDAATGADILYEKNDMSVMVILIPAGYAGDIEIFYQVPVIWHIVEVISLLTAIGMIGYGWIVPRMRRKKA